jgi:hypothetical protein
MTLNDIKCNRDDSNSNAVTVEHNGTNETIYVTSSSKAHAIQQIERTGWFINSSRNIVR